MKLSYYTGILLLLLGFITPAYAEVPFNGLLLDRELNPKKGQK